jgi:ABC-type dipeptide/oligopeptide/nickel transport system permease subunit
MSASTNTGMASMPARRSAFALLLRDPAAVLAGGILIVLVLAALLAPLIAPHDPYANAMRLRLRPIGTDGYPLGTDTQGRDMITRMLYGLRATLAIGFVAVATGGLVGATIGLLAAYYRRLDTVLMRGVDTLLSFPSILFGLAIAAVLTPGIASLVIALSIAAIPSIARIARGAATSVMQQDYMEAGRALGLGDWALLTRYLARNCAPTILIYLTLQLGQTILLGAALSFLGLGAQPPTPTWGLMISEAKEYMFFTPWIIMIPGIALFVLVLGVNLLGDALRDMLGTDLSR